MRKTLLLTGILAVIGLTSGAVPAPASGITFGPPVTVSANDNQAAAEPSIRAARDGNIYIVAPTGLGGARVGDTGSGGDLLWRSKDKGKTWEFLGNYDPGAGGGDADVAVDTKGVVWTSGLTLANTTVGVSTDEGQSFKINPIGNLETNEDRQWIETYKDQPFAFLTTGVTTDMSLIVSRIERLPGDYPAATNTVTVSGSDVYQWPGEIAVDEINDRVYVAYNTDDSGGGGDTAHDRIVVASTDLNLGDIANSVVTKTEGDTFDSFVAVDTDEAGNVYVVWTERRPQGPDGKFGSTNSYLAVSKDKAKTWSAPMKLNDIAHTTTFPWVVAGSKGRVAVAYYGIRHRGASPEKVVYPKRRIPKWKVWVAYSLNADGASPQYTETKAKAKYIHAGNICTSGTGCASGTRDLLDFFQLDLDPCGHIVITYTDNSRDVVTSTGERTTNNPELIGFVGQTGGPSFYATPKNPDIC
jgi:hypothetical protein